MTKLRFAVASRDGVSVNERFQRSEDCLVFEAGATGVVFVERRPLPVRSTRDYEAIADALADCQHVLALMFAGAARRALNGKGIAFHEGRGPIEPRIREILSRSVSHDGTGEPGTPAADSEPEITH